MRRPPLTSGPATAAEEQASEARGLRKRGRRRRPDVGPATTTTTTTEGGGGSPEARPKRKVLARVPEAEREGAGSRKSSASCGDVDGSGCEGPTGPPRSVAGARPGGEAPEEEEEEAGLPLQNGRRCKQKPALLRLGTPQAEKPRPEGI